MQKINIIGLLKSGARTIQFLIIKRKQKIAVYLKNGQVNLVKNYAMTKKLVPGCINKTKYGYKDIERKLA
jgi:hypothetical protein